MASRDPILGKIIDEARAHRDNGGRLLAIFDLDSTLFDVSPRIHQILKEFSQDPEMQRLFPKETHLLKQVQSHSDAYGIRRSLEKVGIMDPDVHFRETITEYWRSRFFTNPYLKYDVPYPGSSQYLNELHDAGAEIGYLTGRDVDRMLEGTILQLKTHGFPLNDGMLIYHPPEHEELLHAEVLKGPNGALYLKPYKEMDDALFKKDFFAKVDHRPGPVYFFENEPANIHLVEEHCPHIQIIFVETVHSGKTQLPSVGIPRIRSF